MLYLAYMYHVAPEEVLVGTCGFSARGGRKKYFEVLPVVEIQDTFYRIVRESTLRRWREEAPSNFEYTLKAFQGITHPASSPTWRRSNLEIRGEARKNYGFFRPTREVLESWRYTLNAAKLLRANFIVIQTPPSFKPTQENVENMKRFFSTIDRGGATIGWEPRGEWNSNQQLLRKILEELDLVHIVDPLKRREVMDTGTRYYRLHGLGPREVNYRYKYTDSDLARLAEYISSVSATKVYVMFNNVYMFENALRFKKIAEEVGLPLKQPS